MNRDKAWVGAAAAVAFVLVWYARGDAPVQQGVARRPIEPPAASFRITLGIGDSAPQAWDGEVVPGSGQVEVEEDELRLHKYAGPGGESGPDPDLPSDRITHDRRHWIASTRPAPRRSTASPLVIEPPSVLVHLRSGAENAPVEVRTVRGSFRFTPAELPLFRPAPFLDGKVRVERVPPVAAIAQEQLGHQDLPALWATGSGDLWVAWQEYDDTADAVYARRRGRTGWEPAWRLDSGRDVFGVAVAEDGRGNVWVIWSMQVNGNWDLYGRFHDGRSWSASERLTSAAGPDVFHRAARDGQGRLWVVWTRPVAGGRTAVFARRREGRGWSAEEEISPPGAAAANSWFPALACGPTGAAVAWDAYTDGSYNVFLRRFADGRWGPVETVAGTGLFEAEPTVAIDAQNRVWVAWIESGANWGKDTGFLVGERKGTPLYSSRAVRVACFDGRRLETSSRLEDALGPAEHWEAPQLVAAPGGPWLVLRHMRWRQSDMRTTHTAGAIYWGLWQFHLTRYSGGSWSAPVRLPRSGSRNDGKAAATVDPSGTLWLVWGTDQRDTRAYLPIQNRVELAQIALPASSAEPQLVPAAPPASPAFSPIHPREAEQVGRIRSYRIDHGGKRYAIYRGDLHRHTEVSIDGGGDGSLFDTYRYARDAAALDFLGVTDHTHDVVEPYSWWRTQKVADLFQIQNAFAAFYAYERSVEYPNGHRNVVFVRRGIDVLPIEYDEFNGWEGSERLFWYLRRNRGLSIPHTSGTSSGTDWRDNDPEVENLVEIFQGMRQTYEYPGAPSPKRLTPSPKSRAESSSLRPLGFVWNALAKGYRLGFIASSDHMSTHISYACLIAEQLTLESLREAMHARRAYAATDNIVLDARFIGSDGEHLMGEDFASTSPIRIRARILGTGPVSRVDVVRNGAIVYGATPNTPEVNFEYVDEAPPAAEAYYYVRVIQSDGEMAWGSPAWVRYQR